MAGGVLERDLKLVRIATILVVFDRLVRAEEETASLGRVNQEQRYVKRKKLLIPSSRTHHPAIAWFLLGISLFSLSAVEIAERVAVNFSSSVSIWGSGFERTHLCRYIRRIRRSSARIGRC